MFCIIWSFGKMITVPFLQCFKYSNIWKSLFFVSSLTSKSEMVSVKESFMLDWSWFHLPQRTVHTWVTWLPILHIPSWAHWACVCVCAFVRAHAHVCRLRMGPFPWFQQRRQDVFVREGIRECIPQTNERGKREKRERTGQQAFLEGLRTRCGVIFILLTLKFLLCVCVCTCITTTVNQWAFGRLRTVRVCLTLNERKREIYGLHRQMDRTGRKRERKGGLEWRQVSLKLLIFSW